MRQLGGALVLMIALAACASGESPPADAGDSPFDAGAPADAETATIDAAPGTPDAAPGTPDAAPGTPDAAPGTPDAPPTPVCGDGLVQSGEECDGDGAGTGGETATCDADCTAAACGDGLVNTTAGETCDGDGAGTGGETATCDTDCTAAMCGDNVRNATAGEVCDDGDVDDCTGTCNAGCTGPANACNDGVLRCGETCEDGNTNPGDGCFGCSIEAGACCVGPSSCAPAPLSVTASALGLAIPDNGYPVGDEACVALPLTCNSVTVSTLAVGAGIDHTWLGDLSLTLTAPDTSFAVVMDRPGEPASTFGDSSNLDSAFPILFDDAAATSAENMGSTIGTDQAVCRDDAICSFLPSPDTLSFLTGTDVNGTWSICVGDSADFDTGTLESVELQIN